MKTESENTSPFAELPKRKLSTQELKAEARLAQRRESEAEHDRKLLEEFNEYADPSEE